MTDPPVSESSACHFHPDRRAGVSCQRCGKRICPACMRHASVGFHCPDCTRTGRQRTYQGRAAFRGAAGVPYATYVLIAVNLALFVAALAGGATVGGGSTGDLGLDLGLVGGGFTGSPATGFELIGVDDGEWYRLVTGAFLHAGVIHLGFNMFLLWMLGHQLEKVTGPGPYLGIYFTGLFAGSFGALLLDPDALTVGASGAVFGLMSAFVVIQRRNGINPFDTGIGGLIVLNLVFTVFRPGISVGGHVGGLLGGALATWLVVEARSRTRNPWVAVGACAVACVVLAGAGIVAAGTWQDPVFGSG